MYFLNKIILSFCESLLELELWDFASEVLIWRGARTRQVERASADLNSSFHFVGVSKQFDLARRS